MFGVNRGALRGMYSMRHPRLTAKRGNLQYYKGGAPVTKGGAITKHGSRGGWAQALRRRRARSGTACPRHHRPPTASNTAPCPNQAIFALTLPSSFSW